MLLPILIFGTIAVVFLVVLKYYYRTKVFNCYLLKPNKSSGFDYHKANQLFDRLSDLVKPHNFIIGLFKHYQLKLLIDNKGVHGRLRLIIKIDARMPKAILKQLVSDIDPQIEFISTKCPVVYEPGRLSKYKLKRHYAFSLATDHGSGSNPMSNLSRALASVPKSGSIQLEVSMSPSSKIKTVYLRNRLIKGYRPRLYANSPLELIKKILWYSLSTITKIIRLVILLVEEAMDTRSTKLNEYRAAAFTHKIADHAGIKLLDKLYDNLWRVKISTHLVVSNDARLNNIDRQINVAISSYSSSGSNELRKSNIGSLGNDILSSSEIANLFHLPSGLNEQDIFDVNRFKNLAPSPELMIAAKDSVIIGENSFASRKNIIRLDQNARQRHLYILGATGSGKSTLLSNMMVQDAIKGRGLTLIDPHGDLSLSLLKYIDSSRLNNVIYFDPSDIEYPIGLNLLEITAKPDSSEYRLEVDQVVEGVISLFRKLFSDDGDSGGHRVEYIIRNSVYTALSVNDCTIFTVFKILTNLQYRQKVIAGLKNPELINFWQQELGKAGDYQRVKMSAGVTAKIGRLLFSAPSRRVFGQVKSTISFDDILDHNKILICNFAKGSLGEETSKLFGVSVLTKLQQAALKRASTAEEARTSHYLYIDEFQNFATPAVTQMLSESRKYKLFLTIANQSLSQLEVKLSSVILANIGNLLCFKIPNPEDERTLIPIFHPYLAAGDLINMPAYHYYLKSTGLINLPPVSAKTIVLAKPRSLSTKWAIGNSRKNYALNLKLHHPLKA